MNHLDVRVKLAAVLAPLEDTDPNVLVDLVDALEPPALMLNMADPWLDQPDTPCLRNGHYVITAVAGRLVPGAGVTTLEELVAFTERRLALDTERWPTPAWTAPRWFTIGGVNYLMSRGTFTLRLQIQGGL